MQFMVFLSHFYPLSHFFSPGSSMSYCALIFHSFLWPNNVHLIDLPYFCLCICTLVLGVVVWKRNVPPPHRLRYLNIWSPVGGGLGGCGTFRSWILANRSMSHWQMDFENSWSHPLPAWSKFHDWIWRCEFSASCSCCLLLDSNDGQ